LGLFRGHLFFFFFFFFFFFSLLTLLFSLQWSERAELAGGVSVDIRKLLEDVEGELLAKLATNVRLQIGTLGGAEDFTLTRDPGAPPHSGLPLAFLALVSRAMAQWNTLPPSNNRLPKIEGHLRGWLEDLGKTLQGLMESLGEGKEKELLLTVSNARYVGVVILPALARHFRGRFGGELEVEGVEEVLRSAVDHGIGLYLDGRSEEIRGAVRRWAGREWIEEEIKAQVEGQVLGIALKIVEVFNQVSQIFDGDLVEFILSSLIEQLFNALDEAVDPLQLGIKCAERAIADLLFLEEVLRKFSKKETTQTQKAIREKLRQKPQKRISDSNVKTMVENVLAKSQLMFISLM
jgi:hypothetical protein